MPVAFREFTFENRNGIHVMVTLEAPTGTPLVTEKVAGGQTFTYPPNVSDVLSAKVTVAAKGHESSPDTETIDLTGSGSPYATYIETLHTRSNIGSIHGAVSAQF